MNASVSQSSPMNTSVGKALEDTISETDQSKVEIKNRCRELWAQLQQLQLEIKSCHGPSVSDGDDVVSSSVLNTTEPTKEVQLAALVSTLEQNKVPVIPEGTMSLVEMLKEELVSEVNQLQETEELVRSQRLQMDEEIARMNELKTELSKFKACLKEKLEIASTTCALPTTQVERELLEKNSQLTSLNRNLLQKLNVFLQKHYPPLTEDQVKDWYKNHNSGSTKSRRRMLSIQSIIEQLMTRCIESPEDPYLTLDETFWPPYIETLLRSGIISRHPEKSQRISMTPYHL